MFSLLSLLTMSTDEQILRIVFINRSSGSYRRKANAKFSPSRRGKCHCHTDLGRTFETSSGKGCGLGHLQVQPSAIGLGNENNLVQ